MKRLQYTVTHSGVCAPLCPHKENGAQIGSIHCQQCKYNEKQDKELRQVHCTGTNSK